MQAVISGRSGLALVIDGDKLSSIHADDMAQTVARRPGDFDHLFGDADDLQFLEDVNLAQIKSCLDIAHHAEEALHLALVVFDPDLQPELRQDAADELNILLSNGDVARRLEYVLYAQPLPPSADIAGARQCSEGDGRSLVGEFIRDFLDRQEAIRDVRLAWDQTPLARLDAGESRVEIEAVLVREGLFREWVLSRSTGEAVDKFVSISLLNPQVKAHPKRCDMINSWAKTLELLDCLKDAHTAYSRAEEHVNDLRLEDSVRELGEAVRILEPCVDDPRASDACKQYREAADALRYLIERRTRFGAAESDPHLQLKSLVNWSPPACRGEPYEHVVLYRRACALSFSELIDAISQACPPPGSEEWRVASTAVGHFGELAASEEHRSDPDNTVLDLARQTFHQVAASLRQDQHAEPGFFAFAVLGTLLLFENVNPTEWPIAHRRDVAEYAKRLQRAKENLRGTVRGEIEKAWKLGV